jgi:hypothetical protein
MTSRKVDARILSFLGCGLALAVAGCAQKHVQASIPVYSAPAPSLSRPPMTVAPDTNAAPPIEGAVSPPAIPAAALQPPASLPSKQSAPPPPKPAAEQPSVGANAEPATRAPAPQISPQFSPGDQASYQRRTTEDIATAKKNLEAAGGRQLSAAQQDLVGKIRSFLAQSQDASRGGDWARAQNLSQKARLLSTELINSL